MLHKAQRSDRVLVEQYLFSLSQPVQLDACEGKFVSIGRRGAPLQNLVRLVRFPLTQVALGQK